MIENKDEILKTTIKVSGHAYDVCLDEPTEIVTLSGSTRKEYGFNLGIDETTVARISRELDNLQLQRWGYVDADLDYPIYDGSEINIEEPKAITVGSKFQPRNWRDINEGDAVDAILELRVFNGRVRGDKGMAINLASVLPPRKIVKRRFERKANISNNRGGKKNE